MDTPKGEYICKARKKLTEGDTGRKKPLAVGDRVVLEQIDTSKKEAVIYEVKRRRTRLSRSHPANPRLEQIIAANVDQALIVSAVKEPPLTVGIIDRYVIAAEYGGIVPIICINKIDLISSDETDYTDTAQIYRQAGYQTALVSAESGEGLETLKNLLIDKTTVIAGHSGVGKSSIINALQPGLELKTAPLGYKGKHCTATASLLGLDMGGYVVDTPGIRELQPWDIDKGEVQQFFTEIWKKADECKLPACTHTHEPNCAVKKALEEGEIPRTRYDSYVAIVQSVGSNQAPRATDVDDPGQQIPKKKRQRSRRRRRQDMENLIDENWKDFIN